MSGCNVNITGEGWRAFQPEGPGHRGELRQPFLPLSRLRRSWLLLPFVLILMAGCGDVEGPEPPSEAELPSLDVDRDRTDQSAEAPEARSVVLTFHRGEEAVDVTRTLAPREAGGRPQEVRDPADQAEETLAHALALLVRGPSPKEREQGLHSFFSAETGDIVREVRVDGERVVVDFRDFRELIPNASTSAGSEAFLTELNRTVFANSPAQEVEYRLDGSCQDFWAFLQRGCTQVPRNAAPDSR